MAKLEDRLAELEARLLVAEKKAAQYDKYSSINKESYERRKARIAIREAKCTQAGIVVTKAEEDAYLAKHKK